jgi:transposase InsO family protein
VAQGGGAASRSEAGHAANAGANTSGAERHADQASPIFPELARDKIVDGPNQVWVADNTYIAIATGFVYMAAILDAWSRRVVGYAISHSMDARLAVAALKAAIRPSRPPTAVSIACRASHGARLNLLILFVNEDN